ncbi:MAG: hypothetical protein HY698_16995 [Deltaproteobacteria bacterium]|nr:hypothetical protein [Deltaproteobacteria bacterium]
MSRTTPQPTKNAKKKAKPAPRSSGRKPGDLTEKLVRASAARRKEFNDAMERVRKLREKGSVSFDELWEEVARLVDGEPPLFMAGGHRTLEEFLKKELPGETRRTVHRNILVALAFSPADEAKHGIAFLEEVAQYARTLASAEETPRAIDLDRLRVSVRKNGKLITKMARQATIDEIRAARRVLTVTKRKEPTLNPAEDALRKAIRKGSGLREMSVVVRKDAARFSPVPLEKITAFGKVLSSVKMPS